MESCWFYVSCFFFVINWGGMVGEGVGGGMWMIMIEIGGLEMELDWEREKGNRFVLIGVINSYNCYLVVVFWVVCCSLKEEKRFVVECRGVFEIRFVKWLVSIYIYFEELK